MSGRKQDRLKRASARRSGHQIDAAQAICADAERVLRDRRTMGPAIVNDPRLDGEDYYNAGYADGAAEAVGVLARKILGALVR